MAMRTRVSLFSAALLLFTLLPSLCAPFFPTFAAQAGQASEAPLPVINHLADLNGKNVGVLVGTYVDEVVERNLDYVTIEYFDDYDHMEAALINGEIDALWSDYPILKYRENIDPRLRVLNEVIETSNYAFGFRNADSALRSQVDAVIRELMDNGQMEQLINRWVHEDGEGDSLGINPGMSTGKALRLGITNVMPPFTFFNAAGEPVGLEVDLARIIAQRLGRLLVIEDMPFSSLISALKNGKVDIIGSAIAITKERKIILSFSISYFSTGVVPLVRR